MAFRKIKAGLVNADVGQFVGETGNLFFDTNDGALRLSDGVTPGGNLISSGGSGYTLPTASTTTKGGVKVDGTTITISNQIISATQQDLSSYATQTFVTTRGYLTSYSETDPVFLAHAAYNVTNTKITNWDTAYGWGNHASAGYLTSVGTISYNDLSNKPTLFSGSYTDLTNKPTIPTTVTVNGTAITLDTSGSLNSLINGSDTLSLDGANKVNLPGGTAYIFSAANTVSLLSDSSGDNSFELINNVGATLYTDSSFEIRTNKGAIDRIFTFTQGGGIQFPDATTQTTAYTTNAARASFSASNASASGSGGSLAYSNGVFTFTPALNITGNAATVTNGVYTTGSYADPSWITSLSYSKLTGVPASIQPFTFNVAADDSTSRTISSEETIKFIGAGGITTTSDAEGAITITGGSTTIGTTAIALGSSSTTLAGLTSIDGAASSFTLLGSPTSVTAFATASTITLGYTNNAGTTNTFNISTNAQAFGTTKIVNIGTGSAANSTTNINIGSTSGSSTVTFNGNISGSKTSQDLFNEATTINFGGAASTINIGTETGTSTAAFKNIITVLQTVSVLNNSATNKYIGIGTSGQLFDDGNFHIHANSGTLWLNSLDSGDIKIGTQYNSGSGSDVYIGKNLAANSGSITANATTAFIAGANAVSGVALQVPQEGALRNLTNGSTNMYFDVSIGGSAHGQFSFRSSSSYTSVATMSTTAVAFNTGATVTARTPALARTAFNAAIDTEITVDNMRFRVSNQGGIFPQVIGNGSSRNLAWTGVGAISGTAVTQVGSTGTIVSSSAWTTLYNSHGMDSAGDTVTVTLQDKAGSAIYRITFMRSDNGSTTGYNIIGERIL